MGSDISKEIRALAHRDIFPAGYGGVILVLVETYMVNMYLTIRVVKARKEYHVEYPQVYSDSSTEFNCIQRSHQNFLESTLFFIPFLLISGIEYPKLSTLAGNIYLLGRVLYAHGYSSADMKKRIVGFRISLFGGMLPLVSLSGLLAITALKRSQLG